MHRMIVVHLHTTEHYSFLSTIPAVAMNENLYKYSCCVGLVVVVYPLHKIMHKKRHNFLFDRANVPYKSSSYLTEIAVTLQGGRFSCDFKVIKWNTENTDRTVILVTSIKENHFILFLSTSSFLHSVTSPWQQHLKVKLYLFFFFLHQSVWQHTPVHTDTFTRSQNPRENHHPVSWWEPWIH